MQLMLTSTDQLTTLDGVPVRVWQGHTADGVPCIAFIHRVAISTDADASDFETDLQEQLPPARPVPLSAVL